MTPQRIFSVIAGLLAVAMIVVLLPLLGAGPETYTITADVEQAPNLFERGRVMVRGVEVGEIVSVEPRPEGVRVTMEIEEGVAIPDDATLAVIPITVISDRYVQFFPAYSGGPKLEDGAHVPLARTAIPAELDDVLAQLKGFLSALEPRPGQTRGPVARLVESLDRTLDGRSEELAGALDGSAAVLDNLARSQSDITGLVRNLDRLFLALANRSSEIGIVNERFALVAEALLADQDNLEGTIENLSLLADEATGLITESGDELGESFGRLDRVLRTILAHQRQLSRGIAWSNVIAQALGETDRNGRGRFAYTGLQAPVGTPRATYNYRLETRDTITCGRIEELSFSALVLNPNAKIEDVTATALSYVPDPYDDDLRFLLNLLVPLCTSVKEHVPVTSETLPALAEIREEVGEERFLEMLARYVAEGAGS